MTEPLASMLHSYLLGIPASQWPSPLSMPGRRQPRLVRRGLALRSLALAKGMLLLFGAATKKTGAACLLLHLERTDPQDNLAACGISGFLLPQGNLVASRSRGSPLGDDCYWFRGELKEPLGIRCSYRALASVASSARSTLVSCSTNTAVLPAITTPGRGRS